MPAAVRVLGGLLSRPLVGRGDIRGIAKGGYEQALGDSAGIDVLHQSHVVLVVHQGRKGIGKDVVVRVPDMGVGVEHPVGNERGQFPLEELPVFLARGDIVGTNGCHKCLLQPQRFSIPKSSAALFQKISSTCRSLKRSDQQAHLSERKCSNPISTGSIFKCFSPQTGESW